MTGQPRNLSASVAARLLNRAKETGDVYQTLLTSFCFERFLYRLGVSDVHERFVLKGAMLLRLVGSALSGNARSGPASPG
jgi:hypothetical protein